MHQPWSGEDGGIGRIRRRELVVACLKDGGAQGSCKLLGSCWHAQLLVLTALFLNSCRHLAEVSDFKSLSAAWLIIRVFS